MIAYIIKRLLIAIPMLLMIALITFCLMRLSPGNYLDTIRMDPQISEEVIKSYENLYQLNKPVWMQYIVWVKNLSHLQFGHSFYYNVPVSRVIAGRLVNTLILSFASFLLTWMVALPLGIWAAVHRNRFIDRVVQMFSYAALSTPSFFLAIVLLYAASRMSGLPLGGMVSPNHDDMNWLGKTFDVLSHLIIPTLALSIGSIAALQRITRGTMLDVLGQKYILTARAKGLPENRVIYHHALRNAINPLVTLLGFEFSALLSGAALIEIICSWPGLGSLMLTAVRSKDVYLVMASMMMGGIMYIVGNLIADIALAKVDPRIRYD